MKKILLITAMVWCGFMSAFGQTDIRTTKGTVISEDYVFIKIDNLVEVSYSTHDIDGHTYLNVHFRNLSQETRVFTWSLQTPDGETVSSENTITLSPEGLANANRIVTINGDGIDLKLYQVLIAFN